MTTTVTTPIALSSQDITLAQSALRILDNRFGGKARAALVIILSVLTAATAILQQASSVLNSFPQYKTIGAISMFIAGGLSFIGRFTPIFNNVLGTPPVKTAPAAEVIDLPTPAPLMPPPPAPLLPPPPPVITVEEKPDEVPDPPHQIPIMIQSEPKPLSVAIPVE